MYKYDKKFYADLSEKTAFQRDILEKVHRLTIILGFLNSASETQYLALKGGSAINLTVFNLPRLSVDIDMDFCIDATREEMLERRSGLNTFLKRYFELEGYAVMPKSKRHFSLNSWVIGYQNASGNHDTIKVEINYSLRQHILPVQKRKIQVDVFAIDREVSSLSTIELFAGKIAALINRTAARDIFDIYNLSRFGIIDESDYPLLRKCVVFYKLISSDDLTCNFDTINFDELTDYKVKTDLIPMLRKKEAFDLQTAKNEVKKFINNLMQLCSSELAFIESFKKG